MLDGFILAQAEPPALELESSDTGTVADGSAQGQAPADGQAPRQPGIMDMLPFLLLLAGMFIFMTMGSRKKDKERKRMLGEMKKNDRVRTIGGIIGTIVEVREKEVLVKIDESNNTRVKFVRDAIAEIVKE